jgi:glycosyltransferase involved in cell wall biosynthesis
MLSIIVPCYNQAQYLSETLQSVLDQSFTDWECIIVNDGSPDNTEEIAKQWCEKDRRFKYLRKENGGVSAARNAGISMAQGEWILPLDADDKIASEYLERAHAIMISRPDVGLIYAKAAFFGEENATWNLPPYDYKTLLKYNHIYCSAFYKKEDWAKTGGYDVNMKAGWEDWEFWINLMTIIQKEAYRLDYTGFYYRIKVQSRNVSFINDADRMNQTIVYIFKKHIDTYIENFGTFQTVLKLNDNLKTENETLKGIVSRYGNFFLIKILRKLYRFAKNVKGTIGIEYQK